MNLPNKLTILRIALTFLFVAFLELNCPFMKAAALIVFIIASLTDYYDGKIARKRQEITDFGKIMDPIADKILILGAFLVFLEKNLIQSWMVIVIILRELLITGVRLFGVTKGRVLAAEASGKHKTVFQIITIFYILAILIVKEILMHYNLWSINLEFWFFHIVLYALMVITLSLTLISGVLFLKRNITIT